MRCIKYTTLVVMTVLRICTLEYRYQLQFAVLPCDLLTMTIEHSSQSHKSFLFTYKSKSQVEENVRDLKSDSSQTTDLS